MLLGKKASYRSQRKKYPFNTLFLGISNTFKNITFPKGYTLSIKRIQISIFKYITMLHFVFKIHMNKKVSHILSLTMKWRKHTIAYLCGYNAQAIHYLTITIFYT